MLLCCIYTVCRGHSRVGTVLLGLQVHQYLEDHGATASRRQIESFVEAVKVC